MTSLYMTTSNRRVSKSKSSNDIVDKNQAPIAVTPSSSTAANTTSPAITSIGSTILRKFERITSLIDESLDSDALLPSLCHKQGANTCFDKLNDTSYISTDNTTLDITGDSSLENSFVHSPTSLANECANECNLHFATWLQSQEFDASGIVSHGDYSRHEEEEHHSIQFSPSREEDDVDEYVSIQNADKRRGNRANTPWPPKLSLAVTDVWDSIVSSNWKCWDQHDKGKEPPKSGDQYKLPTIHPPPMTTKLVKNPSQPNNRNKDSSYTVDALEGTIPMKLLSSVQEELKTAADHVTDSISNKTSSLDEPSKVDIEVDKISPSIITDVLSSCRDVASQQDTQQAQTSSPTPTVESITPSSTAKGTIIGDLVRQENSQLPMISTTPSPSLAGSSLVGEDITVTSNHSYNYSASPDRAESSIRNRKSMTFAAAPPDNTSALPPVEGSPQTSDPEATKNCTTVVATTAVDEFDDSFPSVMQLPQDDNEVHEGENCCRVPLMDTSVLNSSDDCDDDQVDGGPSNKATKDRTSALKMKWTKATSRSRRAK